MSINQRIFQGIADVCKDDENLAQFIKKMVMVEANQQGRYKETYKKHIKEFTNREDNCYEN